MRTIFVDFENKCHVTDDGNMTAVETDFFDGKCEAFVEGFCFDINIGVIYAYKPYSELDAVQREYERERLKDAETALAILLGGEAV